VVPFFLVQNPAADQSPANTLVSTEAGSSSNLKEAQPVDADEADDNPFQMVPRSPLKSTAELSAPIFSDYE
jgi:hypothetical protein